MKLDKICRTCLMEKMNLRNLFEACVADMLMSCASVQVLEGDGLPPSICTQCLQSVNRSYAFKQLAEQSDFKLRNYLINEANQQLMIDDVKAGGHHHSMIFDTNEPASYFQDIFNDNTTVPDLDETMQTLQCLMPPAWGPSQDQLVDDQAQGQLLDGQGQGHLLQDTGQQLLESHGPNGLLQSQGQQLLESQGHQQLLTQDHGQLLESHGHLGLPYENFNLEPLFKCQFCEEMLKDEWSLSEHIKVHTGAPSNNKYFCNICNKICSTTDELNAHVIEHTFIDLDEKNEDVVEPKCGAWGEFTCHICDRQFGDAKFLKKHMKEVHFMDTGLVGEMEKKHICIICGSSYKSAKALSIHARKHTGEKPLKCDICGKAFALPSSFHKHKNQHTGVRRHECSICGKRFNQSSHLNDHLKTHLGRKSHTCSICGKSFHSNTTLTVHTRIHTGLKPYACDFCEHSFTTSSQLRKHRMIHTGEKPYPCARCGRTFRRKESRDTHARYHTGERPYGCTECGKRYIAASHLREHTKTHNNDRRFECVVCLKKFFDARTLKGHVMTHCNKNLS